MSGIVGILHLDQSPVGRHTLQGLTDFLTFRGPDAQQIWLEGPVGFGHTLLKTAAESETEHQPFSLDGATWIVADARLDARSDLIDKLEDRSQPGLAAVADVELLLRAYLVWGESCVDHFLGDFAFAIWDGPRQRLFCARDHLGIKPFYYAQKGSLVIFSNTLECIRQHPAVSDELNDLAVADFLLLQRNQDLATTTFADIQRLPPAHTATWSREGKQSRCYWTMPVEPPLFLRRPEDYLERFKELLQQCVGDRLRTKQAGVFMSGGLDSTSLAAGAAGVLRARSPGNLSLWALTRNDPADPAEKECAELTAKALAIPIHFFDCGDASIDRDWQRSPLPAPEPALHPWELAATRQLYRHAGTLSRVFLHGEGPDHGLLFEWQNYVSYLLAQGRYGRVLHDLYATVMGAGRSASSRSTATRPGQNGLSMQLLPGAFPEWVNPTLETQYGLRHRWEDKWLKPPAARSVHPIRPVAYASFQDPVWSWMFDGHDAAWTGSQIEVRHPFLDLRMLRFLLVVPPLPWCKQKYLMRRAMRGVLPQSVLGRAKGGVPWATLIGRVSFSAGPFDPVPELGAYVDMRRFPTDVPQDQWLLACGLRVRSLNNWLQYKQNKSTLHKI